MAYSTLPSFPSLPGIGLPVTRTPIWKSLVQESLAGVELAQQPWTYPRYKYEMPFEFLRQASAYGEMQTLMGFINLMYGRQGVFQYSDPQDNTASTDTGGQPLGIAASSTSSFQMLRARGGFVAPVFAISTITKVLVAGSSVSTSAFSITNKGIITFSTIAAGNAVAWLGTFNWFCRFDQDDFAFEQFTAAASMGGPLWSVSKLSFTTVKFGA